LRDTLSEDTLMLAMTVAPLQLWSGAGWRLQPSPVPPAAWRVTLRLRSIGAPVNVQFVQGLIGQRALIGVQRERQAGGAPWPPCAD
jgi:hypothetical protein